VIEALAGQTHQEEDFICNRALVLENNSWVVRDI
jgi:hypothetical protein